MKYDPVRYWTEAGRNPQHWEHHSHFKQTPVFQKQEERLMVTLAKLPEPIAIFEAGCGWGRITRLVRDLWPDAHYDACDLSPERIAIAAEELPDVGFQVASLQEFVPHRRYDLVLAVEVLMHIPPPQIGSAVDTLCALSGRDVVSLDWTEPINRPVAPWNFIHDYEALYGDRLVSVEEVGQQSIFVAR